MKHQIIVIHGGHTYKTYKAYFTFLKGRKVSSQRFKNNKQGWKDILKEELGKAFEVITPRMPNAANAKYAEWKIWFEKGIPYFKGNLVFIGHSLGGIFLAKYLSENRFPKKICATFIIAAPFDTKHREKSKSLADFTLPKSLRKFEKQGGKVFLYFSKDDPTVPFVDFRKYEKELKNAVPRVFAKKKHFNQEKFPELVQDIKNLYNKN